MDFVSPERIRNLLRVCRGLGISARITMVATRSNSAQHGLDVLKDEAFEVPFTQVKCLPVGRARVRVDPKDFLPPSPWDRDRACKSDFDTLAITHDGSVYPCCAVGGFTHGLKLGSVHDETIEELMRRRDDDIKWAILSSQGPAYFIKRATDEELKELDIVEGDHDCVKCNRIFSTQLGMSLVDRVQKLLLGQAEKIIEKFNEEEKLMP